VPSSAAESGRLASSCRPVMGGRFNCVGAWSCLRRAGLPRSLLSPPGEAFWPSGPMDHGVQRRERGGGQAAGPAARPELAAPSAAAVPREIPTCSASLLFRLSGPLAAACHRQFLRPSSSMRSAPGRSEVMRQPDRWCFSPRYPRCDAIITTWPRSAFSLCSACREEAQMQPRPAPPTHCHAWCPVLCLSAVHPRRFRGWRSLLGS
jgi:hypothetical protein